MEEKYFNEYGLLSYLDPDSFNDYDYERTTIAEPEPKEGITYDIVFNVYLEEYFYTTL